MDAEGWTERRHAEYIATLKFFTEWYKKQNGIDPLIYPMTSEENDRFRCFDNMEECYDHILTYEFEPHCYVFWDGDHCSCQWRLASPLNENYWEDIFDLEQVMGTVK